MKRDEEKRLIIQALGTKDVEKETMAAVRQILKERVEEDSYADNVLHDMVAELANFVTPRLVIKRTVMFKHEPLSVSKLACSGIAGALGLWLIQNDSSMLRWCGGLAVAIGGFFLGKAITMSKVSRFDSINVKIDQEAQSIINEIDLIYESMHNIVRRNQLENQYASVLRWIQDLWVEGDEEIQNGVRKLLVKIKYELVDFAPEYSDFFDADKSPSITSPATTKPAVRNKGNGDIVVRGNVLFPM